MFEGVGKGARPASDIQDFRASREVEVGQVSSNKLRV
jgi:hypothetical protein